MDRKVSAHFIPFLENEEGVRLTAYQDAKGVWTIGVGHTGKEVVEGLVWTQAECDHHLLLDIAWATFAVNQAMASLKNPRYISQNQFDALVSFTFNEGAAALRSSCIMRYIGQGYYDAAAKAFLNWERVGNNAHMLHNRRMREKALFETPDPPDLPPSIAV